MDPRHLVRLKQEGGAFPPEDMRNFLRALLADEVSDAQTAALMAMVFAHGMTPQELVDWTRAKLDFTVTLERGSSGRPRLDKHSTGGVGDKVSLALAPALIACGAEVPMISGRGLGHTGGREPPYTGALHAAGHGRGSDLHTGLRPQPHLFPVSCLCVHRGASPGAPVHLSSESRPAQPASDLRTAQRSRLLHRGLRPL